MISHSDTALPPNTAKGSLKKHFLTRFVTFVTKSVFFNASLSQREKTSFRIIQAQVIGNYLKYAQTPILSLPEQNITSNNIRFRDTTLLQRKILKNKKIYLQIIFVSSYKSFEIFRVTSVVSRNSTV